MMNGTDNKEETSLYEVEENPLRRDVREYSESYGRTSGHRYPVPRGPIIFAAIGLAILIVTLCITFFVIVPNRVNEGVEFAETAYIEAENNTEKEIRQTIFAAAYLYSEKQNHVSNTATAMIKNIEMTKKLEVLNVSNIGYVFTGTGTTDEVSPEQVFYNNKNITGWFEIKATGSFTVDLTRAEVVSDNERKHISIILPSPEVQVKTKFSAPYVEGGKFDDKTSDGKIIADNACSVGLKYMRNTMNSDPNYIQSAKQAAKKLITNMIKNLNAEEIPDLSVNVVFFDDQGLG